MENANRKDSRKMEYPKYYLRFRAGLIYAKEEGKKKQAIEQCIQNLRSQGFQIHDFGNLEHGENCLELIRDSDVMLLFCSPKLKACADAKKILEDDIVRQNIMLKYCILAIIDGNEKNAVPAWIDAQMAEQTNHPVCLHGNWNTDNMDILLGDILRKEEADKLRMQVGDKSRRRICLHGLSIKRRKDMDRFILDGRTRYDYVRVLLTLGKCSDPDMNYPEWILYEDPNHFLPDRNGNITVKLARIGKREMSPVSGCLGAYYLGVPADIQIPEDLMYEGKKELLRHVLTLLKKPAENSQYYQADRNDLYEQDMELNLPLPEPDIFQEQHHAIGSPDDITRKINIWLNKNSDRLNR